MLSTSEHNYFESDIFLSASYPLICKISVPPFPISYTCKKQHFPGVLEKGDKVYQI